ncbi:LamG domain-containing protein, partial [Patescibacteria group bacterium]
SSATGWLFAIDTGDSDRIEFVSRNDTVNVASNDSVVGTTEWQHVAITADRDGFLTFYVDGDIAGSSNISSTASENWNRTSGTYKIGLDRTAVDEFGGLIDETRIYNRALTPSEVQDLYRWAPGPVAHWKLDENSGTSVYDNSGNGHNSTAFVGNTSWIAGKHGSALSFDGANDHVTIADNDAFTVPSGGQITVEAWIKLNKLNDAQIPISKMKGSNYEWSMQQTAANGAGGGLLTSAGGGYLYAFSSQSLSADRWYHVAFTADTTSEEVYLYVDGVLSGTDTTPSGTQAPNGTANVQIGESDAGTGDFQGSVDDVRIYNYARTPQQIVQDMNAGHPAPGSPVGSAVGHWKFDEGYGDTAHDSSPQGNNNDLGGSGEDCSDGGTPCPTWTNDGKFGKALYFDDSSDYVEVADNTDYEFAAGQSYSISLWYQDDYDYPTNTGLVTKGYHDDSQNCPFYLLRIVPAGQPSLNTRDGTCSNEETTTATTDVTDGNWYHIVALRDSDVNQTRIYVNGVLEDEKTTLDYQVGANSDPLVFMNHYNRYTGGILDEIYIFNSALTADQVKLLYNQGKSAVFGATSTDSSNSPSFSSANSYCPPGQGTACVGPVAEWKMDEKTGQYAQDTSENSNTGTLGSGATTDSADPTWQSAASCHSGACLKFDGSDDYVDIGTSSSLQPSNLTV